MKKVKYYLHVVTAIAFSNDVPAALNSYQFSKFAQISNLGNN